MPRAEIYLRIALSHAPRIISLLNRRIGSRTYGCFDRNYWHYNLIDFPCTRFQEASLTLSLLYSHSYPNNIYFKNEKIRNWVTAAMLFWSSIQHNDGSFDEWYPNERSFVATAFSTYAISEGFKLIGHEMTSRNRDLILNSLIEAGHWLTEHDETEVANQEAGALCALYNLYTISKDVKFKENASEKLERLLSTQTDEGWFPEYQGPDAGYTTLCIDYLAKYLKLSEDTTVLEPLERAVSFISFFFNPDYTFGGEYASRNTEYIIPHGIEILSKHLHIAKYVATQLTNMLNKGVVVPPYSLDDRYSCYNIYTFLQAYNEHIEDREDHRTPTSEAEDRRLYFQKAGLLIHDTRLYRVIINLHKGCVTKIYSKHTSKPSVYSDCGLVVTLSNGTTGVSQWFDKNRPIKVHQLGAKVSGRFFELPSHLLTPAGNILLRGYGLTIARLGSASSCLKKYLRRVLIEKSRSLPISFEKEVLFLSDAVTIHDTITLGDDVNVTHLVIEDRFSSIYTPSSRFFVEDELETRPYLFSKDLITKLNHERSLHISRTVHITNQGIKTSIGYG